MKVTTKENIRLEVMAYEPYTKSESVIIDALKNIEKQIERHVDNVQATNIVWDSVDRCSHCQEVWEEDDEGCPVCCNKALYEWEAGRKE